MFSKQKRIRDADTLERKREQDAWCLQKKQAVEKEV